jgi:epoxyqueuosine reductase
VQNRAGASPLDAENKRRVTAAARALGFDAVGICDLRPIERDALAAWLEPGYAGSMAYMHRQRRKRENPQQIVRGATRAVLVAKSYYTAEEPPPDRPRVARYAWGADYHRIIGAMLDELAAELIRLGASEPCTRGYVDAGPVPERELAQRAGLGWIAKNTMLIHPRLGSFTFLGTVFTDLPLPVDEPFSSDQCGSCRRCLDACPTDAFPVARVLDARRCISYLTIEHRGAFDAAQSAMLGEWLFGCDVCQDVCPWNVKFAAPNDDPRFAPRRELVAPDLDLLRSADEDAFNAVYGDTAFERSGAQGMARNARAVRKA